MCPPDHCSAGLPVSTATNIASSMHACMHLHLLRATEFGSTTVCSKVEESICTCAFTRMINTNIRKVKNLIITPYLPVYTGRPKGEQLIVHKMTRTPEAHFPY